MIITGENKLTLFNRRNKKYYVSDDGTIFDSKFKILKTWINKNGYEMFGSCPVHKIVKYTIDGYRDGKIWHIHHLDGNKLNNHISNLVYIHWSDHSKIHHNKNFQEKFLNHLVS